MYVCMGFSSGSAVNNLPAVQEPKKIRVRFLGWEDSLEEGTATHWTFLAWRILWTEDPCRLQSIVLQRVRHNWSNLTHTYICFCFVFFWKAHYVQVIALSWERGGKTKRTHFLTTHSNLLKNNNKKRSFPLGKMFRGKVRCYSFYFAHFILICYGEIFLFLTLLLKLKLAGYLPLPQKWKEA